MVIRDFGPYFEIGPYLQIWMFEADLDLCGNVGNVS